MSLLLIDLKELVLAVYFYFNDALDDFFDRFVLFNFVHLVRGQAPLSCT